jgi:hypothetical protein
MRRSRAKVRGPLRDIELGVTSPEIRKNRPIANRAAGITTIARVMLLTPANCTS